MCNKFRLIWVLVFSVFLVGCSPKVLKGLDIGLYRVAERPSDSTLKKLENYYWEGEYTKAFELAKNCRIEKICGHILASLYYFGLGGVQENHALAYRSIENVNYNTYSFFRTKRLGAWIRLQAEELHDGFLDLDFYEEKKLIVEILNDELPFAETYYLRALFLTDGYTFYVEEKSLAPNKPLAEKYFLDAIAGKFKLAYLQLANMYILTDDAEKKTKAIELYVGAAEAGMIDAQWMLGFIYKNGIGTPPDREKSVYWLQKAAKSGHQGAISLLQKI